MDTDTNRDDSYHNDENYTLDDDDDNANFNDKSNNPHWNMTIDPANSDTDVLSSDLSRSNELKNRLVKQNSFVMETNDIIRENEELKQKLKFASEGKPFNFFLVALLTTFSCPKNLLSLFLFHRHFYFNLHPSINL